MASIALVVAVLLPAALAAVALAAFLKLQHRIKVLSDTVFQVEARQNLRYGKAPEAALFVAPEIPTEMDIVGAWAEEQERKGVPVSDEEIMVQRRMWAAEV